MYYLMRTSAALGLRTALYSMFDQPSRLITHVSPALRLAPHQCDKPNGEPFKRPVLRQRLHILGMNCKQGSY